VIELLALVEHVLAEQALVLAGGRDRGDMVTAPRPQRVGQPDGVAGPLDIGDAVALLVSGHVVDRGEVEEVVNPGGRELVPGRVVDPESRRPEVTGHRLDALSRLRAPGLDPGVQSLGRALAHEQVDVAIALEQALDEVPADEAGRTRDEVVHTRSRAELRSPAAAPVSVR